MPSLPPNEKTAEWIHIRIHKDPKNTDYYSFCERQFDSYISCYETHSNRPHVHILVKIKVTRSVQISKLLKKQFDFNGNADFSVKNVNPTEKDFIAISQYVCKGDDHKTLPVVIFRSPDWTDELVKQRHDEYWCNEPNETQENHIKVDLNQLDTEPVVRQKIPRKTWTEKIIDELQDEYEEVEWDWHEPKHRQWMIDYVLKKLGDKKKIFNEYKIKEFVYACFNSLDAKNFRDDMSNKVYGLL